MSQTIPPAKTSPHQRGVQLEFVRSIGIPSSPDDLFAYVSDFSRAHEWRTEVAESHAEPPGPMRVGTRLHEVAVIAGRRVVTDTIVDTYDPAGSFTFVHVSGPMPVSGEFLVAATPNGAQLTYTLRVRLHGLWILLAPMLRRSGCRTIDRSLTALAENMHARNHDRNQ